jgi:hypothetical protein
MGRSSSSWSPPAINPPRSSSASNQTRAAENAISQRAVKGRAETVVQTARSDRLCWRLNWLRVSDGQAEERGPAWNVPKARRGRAINAVMRCARIQGVQVPECDLHRPHRPTARSVPQDPTACSVPRSGTDFNRSLMRAKSLLRRDKPQSMNSPRLRGHRAASTPPFWTGIPPP